MEYLNITTAFIMSAAYRGCEPVERATWFSLAGFCALAENGGKIEGCKLWKPRRCEMTLGVTRAELHRVCELWTFCENDLIVNFYPVEQEAIVLRKRGVARVNGAKGGRPVKTNVGTDIGSDIGSYVATQPEPILEPISEPISESVKEGKGKEGKGKEYESAREASDSPAEDPMPEMARRIVETYPRRERVADSLAIVLGHLKAGEPAEAMLAGTQAAAMAIGQAPSGHLNRYIPSARNFFLGKRWQDDPATLFRAPEVNGGKGTMSEAELALQLGPRGAATEFGY